MTRLVSEDINEIAVTLPAYDSRLQTQIGCGLKDLALRSACRDGSIDADRLDGLPTAVIPISAGNGIIGGFASAVTAILRYIGFDAFVSPRRDAGGIADACASSAKMILMADDNSFCAINLSTRQVAENSAATGRGYATALDLMAGGLQDKQVLVLGCGPVGRSAANALAGMGARIGLCDIDHQKAEGVAASLGQSQHPTIVVFRQLDGAMRDYDFIIDATPAKDLILSNHVSSQTMIAAPGVPCGLNNEALALVAPRLIHDPLQIGVATMAMEAWLPTKGPDNERKITKTGC